MDIRYITILFLMAIFSLGLVSAGAIAQEANAPNNGWDYTGQIVVISAPGSMVNYCGVTMDEYKVEVVNPNGGGFGFIPMAFPRGSNLNAGLQFRVLSQAECQTDPSRLVLELMLIED
jgi:hypothetical protein